VDGFHPVPLVLAVRREASPTIGSTAEPMLIFMVDPISGAPDAEPLGRCVCGEKVIIADAEAITLSNGRPGWRGYCPECGAPLFARRRKPAASNWPDRHGQA
jgi:Domain of unknown function (DUF5679)